MNLKINNISLWTVHLSIFLNVIFLIADFTFPKYKEEVILEKVYTRGSDSRKSKKQVVLDFANLKIYGNNKISKVLEKDFKNTYYIQKNVFFNNRAFIEVVKGEGNVTKTIFIGYNCYNPYFIYLLFFAIPAYVFLIYNFRDNDLSNMIPYFAIPLALIFIINIIVQF